HVRSFAPAAGIPEDPVCGSGNATVAAYLVETGMLKDIGDEYVASQGTEMGRDGRVHVRVSGNGRVIEIGGSSVTVIEGQISL
ncbi:MAG: PhzF family phenazine biosynthesis protein, partial [Chloroflexi bacterium]|nr:PhzF family phenazine biosynthesis protein [Chloroflexota bacterium]